VDLYIVNTPLRHSGMARVLKESHSFTSAPCVHPLTARSWASFTDPGGIEGWVGPGGWLHIEINV